MGATTYPDPKLTPGDVRNVDSNTTCHTSTRLVRNVPQSKKIAVFKEYGIPYSEHSKYEVDHFIPLNIGGSNDIKNLWPEPYDTEYGAHQKDWVEFRLYEEVCKGQRSLKDAQDIIRTDWVKFYKQYNFNERAKSNH